MSCKVTGVIVDFLTEVLPAPTGVVVDDMSQTLKVSGVIIDYLECKNDQA